MALLHYLMLGNEERRAQLSKFLLLTSQGKTVDESFQQAFGITYKQLEEELRVYVRKFAMKYTKYSLDELKINEPPKPEPMKRDALLYELGHLLGYAVASSCRRRENSSTRRWPSILATPAHTQVSGGPRPRHHAAARGIASTIG